MTCERFAHLESPDPSDDEVDEYLRQVEGCVDVSRGAGCPALPPSRHFREDAKPSVVAPISPAS
jgi:hypothetical protein